MLRDDTGTEYADSIPGKAEWSQASSGQDVERAAGGQTRRRRTRLGWLALVRSSLAQGQPRRHTPRGPSLGNGNSGA